MIAKTTEAIRQASGCCTFAIMIPAHSHADMTSRPRLPSRCHRRHGCHHGGSIRNYLFEKNLIAVTIVMLHHRPRSSSMQLPPSDQIACLWSEGVGRIDLNGANGITGQRGQTIVTCNIPKFLGFCGPDKVIFKLIFNMKTLSVTLKKGQFSRLICIINISVTLHATDLYNGL